MVQKLRIWVWMKYVLFFKKQLLLTGFRSARVAATSLPLPFSSSQNLAKDQVLAALPPVANLSLLEHRGRTNFDFTT